MSTDVNPLHATSMICLNLIHSDKGINMEQQFPKQVVDEQGNIHRLTKKIGEGGREPFLQRKTKSLQSMY